MTSTTAVATPRTGTLAVVSLLASGVIWGLMWMPLKFFAAQGLTGLAMTLSTYGLVGAVALPFIWMQRQAWRPQARLLLMAGLFGGIANSCFITALMFGEVMRVMLLFYLAPVWGVLGGALFLGERITLARAAGTALAVVGAVLVLGGSEALARPFARSDLLGLASGLFYALTNPCQLFPAGEVRASEVSTDRISSKQCRDRGREEWPALHLLAGATAGGVPHLSPMADALLAAWDAQRWTLFGDRRRGSLAIPAQLAP